MDRRQALARFLTVAALLPLLAASASVPDLPIKEARWLAPDQLFEGLTRHPAECFATPKSNNERRSAMIGRAAFRAPLLLGGQAARAGLSCASCHRNGRGNPHFTFPSLSGHPGTADVTSSLMSKTRGDATFNPKVIPDLVASKFAVSRDPDKGELKAFIRGLIVEEFDGEEPPPAVLDGLTAYVRALSPGACKSRGLVGITLDGLLADVDSAVRLAENSWSNGDPDTALVLVGAARSMLGSVDERFQLPGLEPSRTALRSADNQLRALRLAMAYNVPSVAVGFRAWDRDWPARKVALRKQESRSLFSPSVLRRRLVEVRP